MLAQVSFRFASAAPSLGRQVRGVEEQLCQLNAMNWYLTWRHVALNKYESIGLECRSGMKAAAARDSKVVDKH